MDRFIASLFKSQRIKWAVLRPLMFVGATILILMAHHLLSVRLALYGPLIIRPYHELICDIVLVTLIFFIARYYESKQRELRRQVNSQERLKLFIQHTPAAVAVLDKQMRYLEASDRWLRDYRIADQDIIGKCHYDVFPSIRQMPVWLDDHRRCLAGEKIRREQDSFIGPDGRTEYLTYEMMPWHDEHGAVGGLIFFTEVITDRVEAMLKLQDSEARFERAVNGSNDGIWDVNYAAGTVYYSPRLKKLLGFDDHEMGDKLEDWSHLLHPDDEAAVMAKIEDHLVRHIPYQVEYRLRTKSGDYKWIAARGQAQWDATGNPTYFSGSLVDISERKRLQGLQNEFVYVVSHELRTPLSALNGALHLIADMIGRDVPQKVEKLLQLSLQGCDRLALLIDDLQEAGKAESDSMRFDMQCVDAAKLLEQSVEMNRAYGDRYKVNYELEIDPSPAVIRVDSGRFMQVMANLLSNAAKFSYGYPTVSVRSAVRGDKLEIAVQDRGKGISEDFKSRIFQKFARGTSDMPGTGLGLNITKTMVERMGGSIRFESYQNVGTTFYVTLPLVGQNIESSTLH